MSPWFQKPFVMTLLSSLMACRLEAAAHDASTNPPPGWPEEVREIRFVCHADQTEQPALFRPAVSPTPRPLLVFLHQWGGDYHAKAGAAVARWCVEKDWNFLQPDFRGPNKRPEAMGSDLVLADLESVVRFARQHAPVDDKRIYLLGASGGGYAALLAAGRLPGLFQAVSAWVPIIDLVAWSAQCANTPHKRFTRDITSNCGGPLTPGSAAEAEAIRRSPQTHLKKSQGTIFDLNAGIHDGHTGSVPVSHTLNAYNLLARPEDQVAEDTIRIITTEARVPEEGRFSGTDETYGDHPVLFRAESEGVRVTLFEGGHEMVRDAALAWLEGVSAGAE